MPSTRTCSLPAPWRSRERWQLSGAPCPLRRMLQISTTCSRARRAGKQAASCSSAWAEWLPLLKSSSSRPADSSSAARLPVHNRVVTEGNDPHRCSQKIERQIIGHYFPGRACLTNDEHQLIRIDRLGDMPRHAGCPALFPLILKRMGGLRNNRQIRCQGQYTTRRLVAVHGRHLQIPSGRYRRPRHHPRRYGRAPPGHCRP